MNSTHYTLKIKIQSEYIIIQNFSILYIFFYCNRKDSISKEVDEIIDEIYATDEEVFISSIRKSKSKKKNQNDILKLMKNSISIGNKFNSTNNINFKDLDEAKGVIVTISNELEFHQKQTLKCALQAGDCLIMIQELCAIENKKFIPFLKECNIKWDKSYVYFLISFYNFTKEYPRISNLSLSLHFVMNNFKKIKLAIWSSNAERDYWKNI
jgi:hypothetical protein